MRNTMNIKISYQHLTVIYNVKFHKEQDISDTIPLVNFTNFIQKLFVQSPALFLTDFTTIFENTLVDFKRCNKFEVFTVLSEK